MKANEAPEKIYYAPYGDMRVNDPITENDIEYTRADAFIEKAAQWLKENLLNYTYVYEGEVGIGMAVFLEEFKKAVNYHAAKDCVASGPDGPSLFLLRRNAAS